MIAQVGQQVLPSQTPYTVLDYGVTALVLIVMGIVLWFVFKTQARILKDHADAMADLANDLRIMKEELLTLVLETRHLSEAQDRAETRQQIHRDEQTRHYEMERHQASHHPDG